MVLFVHMYNDMLIFNSRGDDDNDGTDDDDSDDDDDEGILPTNK